MPYTKIKCKSIQPPEDEQKLAHLAMVSMQERQESTTCSSVPSRNVSSSRQIVVAKKQFKVPKIHLFDELNWKIR